MVEQDSPHLPTSAVMATDQPIDTRSAPRLSAESRNTDRSEGTTLAPDTVPDEALNTVVTEVHPTTERSSSQSPRVNLAGRGYDRDEDVDTLPETRTSPGRAGLRTSPSKIMSAIEPQQPNPFGICPVDTSHINAGLASTGAAQLKGGVTMSRSVTAEGMQEAEEIMGGKQLVLQEASKKLAASVAANPRHADDEEEEAKDSLGFDLGLPPRALARKVSPTGIPKYGRSTSAPAGERMSASNGTVNGQDRFGRKASVKGPVGGGLTRSGSKLRTSVYGLADVSNASRVDDYDLMSLALGPAQERHDPAAKADFSITYNAYDGHHQTTGRRDRGSGGEGSCRKFLHVISLRIAVRKVSPNKHLFQHYMPWLRASTSTASALPWKDRYYQRQHNIHQLTNCRRR